MTIQLRDYQSNAISACYAWMQNNNGNPCIAIPTGGGKTPVIATLCNDAVSKWQGRVVVLAHIKELLEQTSVAISRMYPDLWSGVYSAGLKQRDTRPPVVVAGIQSVADKVKELGPRDLIIIDEAHLIPPTGYGRYRQFINEMVELRPHCRVIGLTATPYRTSTGWLCGTEEILNEICYEVSVKTLIDQGYLSKLTSKCGQVVDTSDLHIRGGEFIESEAQALMMGIVWGACDKIVKMTTNRKSVLVFGCGIKHAETIVESLRSMQSAPVGLITGDSLDFERAKYIEDFKSGALKYLVNVNVLTTGFDAPNVDCICLLRPTMSPGLYYQMVGRGFRIHETKENCLVLDFGDNVRRHGPVDHVRPRDKRDNGPGIPPQKICPECQEYCALSANECPDCGFLFDVSRGPKHDTKPAEEEVVSGPPVIEEHIVKDIVYSIHRKRGWTPGTPDTMKVRYKVGIYQTIDEWVCPEHEGFARGKFEGWWRSRSNDPFPDSASRAVEIANAGALAQTLKITTETKHGEKFPRITKYEIGPKPEPTEEHDGEGFEFPGTEETPTNHWADDAPF